MVWYYTEGIAIILSLCNVEKKHKVMYNSSIRTGFVVHKADGTNHVFVPSEKGLYFYDVKKDTAHVMINTVDSNKSNVKEYANACKAQSIHDIIRRLTIKEYIEYAERGLIPNCHIMKRDILRAKDILGPNLGSLKDKTTRKRCSK